MELEMVFGYFLLIAGIALATLLIVSGVRTNMKHERVRKRGKEIISKAKKIGPVARLNEIDGVLGICTNREFLAMLEIYNLMDSNGDLDPADRVQIKVQMTFTFWKRPKSQTLMHVGEATLLRDFFVEIVEKLTGILKDEVSERDFGEAYHQLFVDDGRLYIPFSSTTNKSEDKRSYPKRFTFYEAKRYLEGIILFEKYFPS